MSPFLFGASSFKVVQHNGRGIVLARHDAQQLAGKCIKNLARTAHALCLEEVHGHSQEIISILSLWLPGWKIFSSSALRADGTHNFGAGGVAIALCPAIAAGAMAIDHHILIDGRCNSVSIKYSTGRICLTNLHNYNFTPGQVRRVGSFMAKLAAEDRANPTANFFVPYW